MWFRRVSTPGDRCGTGTRALARAHRRNARSAFGKPDISTASLHRHASVATLVPRLPAEFAGRWHELCEEAAMTAHPPPCPACPRCLRLTSVEEDENTSSSLRWFVCRLCGHCWSAAPKSDARTVRGRSRVPSTYRTRSARSSISATESVRVPAASTHIRPRMSADVMPP